MALTKIAVFNQVSNIKNQHGLSPSMLQQERRLQLSVQCQSCKETPVAHLMQQAIPKVYVQQMTLVKNR